MADSYEFLKAPNRIEELLVALDTLYKYASDDGCPHAERHRFSRPNRARMVIETWLSSGAVPNEVFAVDPHVEVPGTRSTREKEG